MFRRYYRLVKKYFSLGVNNGKLLFHLFLSALLRSLSILLIPFTAAKIIEFASDGEFQTAIIWSCAFLASGLFYVLCWHYNHVAYRNNSLYVHDKLQQLALDKVSTLDEDFSKTLSTAFVTDTAFNDLSNAHVIIDQAFDAVAKLVNMLIAVIILLVTNLLIGCLAAVLLIISMFALSYTLKKREYYLAKQRQVQNNIASLMSQTLDGNKEIKSFNMEEDINRHLSFYQTCRRKFYNQRRKHNDRIYAVIPMFLGLGKLVVYLVTIYLVLYHGYNVSLVILVIGYYENIEDEFESFYGYLSELSRSKTYVDRLYRLLNYKSKNMLRFGDDDADDITGKVEFRHVSFTYEHQQTLRNVSLRIPPHSFTAIVGKSGSGKSTIFRLLLRLYKADKGQILLDDVSIYDYTKEVYASNVSIVTQKPFIFDMSIRENLALVDPNHERQIAACRRAGIHDFIMSLPDGYNTKLVSDAANISSGQKQLIALARTLLSRSEVLLFDEVTSSLDLDTSKQIMRILTDLKRDHTILMITHKPQLMKAADEVIVVDKGRIVGRGTHAELMRNNKYYRVLQQ